MIKRALTMDAVEFDDDGLPIAYKGHMVKVIEIDDLGETFIDYAFSSNTLKTMFWAKYDLDCFGG